jgi:predicted TIM-barrel fold metal-dependent hydrolase
MKRRLEVLDFMGVDRQLLFSTFSLIGLSLACSSASFIEHVWGKLPEGIEIEDVRPLGRMITSAWNDFAVQHQKIDPRRLQMVAILHTTDFDDMMSECERLLAEGIRAIWIPSSVPPGGKSPADRSLGPFWSLCEEADATVLIHLGFEDFLRTYAWRDVPEFESEVGDEFVVDPWSFGTQHMAVENFLTTITLGGVFERHPNLRFGAIECGAAWVGPMAENLDKWAKVFKRRMAKILSMEPSAYLNRNLRATPYWFEPVHKYVNRFGLEDVYVYGSDYPHAEGGVDQLSVFAESTAPLGEGFMEKFFVTNAELILPDRT